MKYHEEYYSNLGNLKVEEFVERKLLNELQLERINRTIAFFPEDIMSVLDVGAGYGVLLELLEKQRNIKGVGVEIADVMIAYGRSRGVDLRKGDASQLEFPDNSFDIVVATEVIEHLPFGIYEKTLSEFERVSRKYIVISVPYNEKRIFVRCPYCSAIVNNTYHLRSFTIESMHNLFSNAKLVRIELIGQAPIVPFMGLLNKIRNKWPPLLICPVCGYREETTYVNNATKMEQSLLKNGIISSSLKMSKGIVKKLLSLMGLKKPRWILALYSVVK